MKRFMTTTAMAILLLCFGCGSEQPAEEVSGKIDEGAKQSAASAPVASAGKYGIKSGIIHFEGTEFDGAHTEILYFEDYGRKERLERYDADGVLAEIKFCDGKQLYAITGEDQIAYILSDNATRGTEMQFNPKDWSERQKEKYQFRDEPDMTIAGKPCSAFSMITSVGKTTYAGWSNITLYYNIEAKYGIISKKAVKVEENASVPVEKFEVPKDYTVQKTAF